MKQKKTFTRRSIMARFGVAAIGLSLMPKAMTKKKAVKRGAWSVNTEEWVATQEIAELRRMYGLATDLIGENTKESIARGTDIYHRIFSANASIAAAGIPGVVGPDAWVEVVNEALKGYKRTQHLIGSQVVEQVVLPNDEGLNGSDTMSSYLQAWHASPDDELWEFIGTYHDKLTFTTNVGWQIQDMVLEHVSGDRRKITTA